MRFNPFAFGAAGFPLCGAEQFVYNFLCAVYNENGKIVKGTKAQLIQGMLDNQSNRYSEQALTTAVDLLITGDDRRRSLLQMEGDSVVPNEHFGIQK